MTTTVQDLHTHFGQKLFVSGYDRAAVRAALGQTDEAFAALEDGYQARAEWMGYLKVDPQMDMLRSDPRYAALLRRLNFSRVRWDWMGFEPLGQL